MKQSLLIILLMFILGGCAYIGDPLDTEATYEFDRVTKLSVDLSVADLTINISDGDQMILFYRSYEHGPEIKVTEGNFFKIKERSDWPFFFGMNQSPYLELMVPAAFEGDFIISTSSGDVTLRDLMGEDFDIKLSSGDLDLKDIQAKNIEIKLSSGDLYLDDVSAKETHLSISSGDATLTNLKGDLDGKSSSGDVFIDLEELSGDIDYDLSSGDFELLQEDENISASFDLSTSSGRVRLGFDLDKTSKNEDDLVRGRIGKGDYNLSIHASSGDIDIR